MKQDYRDIDHIEQIVRNVVKYFLHYQGTIVDNDDPGRNGCVKIMIEELGYDTPDLGLWCEPRMGNSMSLPAKGQSAEVYFLGGDPERPCYLFPCIRGTVNNVPLKFDGMSSTHVLFEEPSQRSAFIRYDNLLKQYEIGIDNPSGKIKLLRGLYKFVFGDILDTWFTSILIPWLMAHTHSFTGTGAVGQPDVVAPDSPSGYLSDNIKGS